MSSQRKIAEAKSKENHESHAYSLRSRNQQRWHLLSEEPQMAGEDFLPHVPLISVGRKNGESESETSSEEEERASRDSVDFIEDRRPHHHKSVWVQLRGDYGSVALLLLLYLLQGIPLGLTGSIPLVLQSRHTTYHQQAMFSFAFWPFSLKLLWAPIVDSLYFLKIGRRKTWLVPTQYLIGIFMFVLSHYVTSVLGDDKETAAPNVLLLTGIFFSFNFLAATQDIAVDGWALTILSKRNVGWASTCNAVGQTAGYFIGNVVFLSLESAEFCNNYLRSEPQKQGIVTLADFVYFWGWIFIITTTLILILKRESDDVTDPRAKDAFDDMGIWGTYKLLWNIIKLKPMLMVVLIHLTSRIGFAAADGITGLKLIELGVPKDRLAFIAIPLVPLQIVLPWVIGRYTAGPKPLTVFLKAYPWRLIFGILFAGIVYWTPAWKQADGHFPPTYYLIIIVAYCLHQVSVYSIYVAVMAFAAKISDPLVGGTYMTLLNTVTNLGGNWPVTVCLWLVDNLTWKQCRSSGGGVIFDGCQDEKECTKNGGLCTTSIDGYFILITLCTVIGTFWLITMRKRVSALHDVPSEQWMVVSSSFNNKVEKPKKTRKLQKD